MMREPVYILGPEDLVLTVNRRLARMVRQRHDRQQAAQGALVWPTPTVMPLTAWLEQCWEQLLDGQDSSAGKQKPLPVLLSSWQERLLWERIITASTEGSLLLRPAEAADSARQAWQRLQEWQVALNEADLYDHEDAGVFYAWSQQFASICQQQGWVTLAALPRLLRQRLAQLILPQRIFLAGFREYGQPLPPLWQTFFSALQQNGVEVAELPVLHGAGEMARRRAASTEEELLVIAEWAAALLVQQPGCRIAVVVPALQRMLPQVVESFARVFYPGINPSQLDPRSKLFNLSLGARLADTPMIRDALALLALARGHAPLEQVTAVLHSPFWQGGQQEWALRSLLDERLRRRGFLHLRLSRLRREAARSERESPACPLLAETLRNFSQVLKADATPGQETSLLPSQWLERFDHWLRLLGWPGERALSSGEQQNRMAWQEALSLLATLDKTAGPLTLAATLDRLTQIVAETPFQPESEEAPVQILGLLEAVGGDFSHLWISGLTVDNWPPPLQPNPLLPIALQRRHAMPFCDAEREWLAAQQRMQTLMSTADCVVGSYPMQQEGEPLLPSPLWLALPPGEEESLACSLPSFAQLVQDSARWQWQQEEEPIPYDVQKGAVSSGVLKAQSLCPFQAYARYRLGAKGRSEPGIGLDAAQRGQLVHAALSQLWQAEAGEVQQGVAWSEQVAARIATAVEQALQQAVEQWPEPLHPFFRRLEQARLSRLLAAFLAVEQERQAPFVVAGQEVERVLRLGPLTVRLRLDRLDRLADGSLLVLDYKTGLSRIDHWLGERPWDPQLPLYVLAESQNSPQPVVGLAFCQIRAGLCRFSGLAEREGLLPEVDNFQQKFPEMTDWSSLLAEWQRVLTGLAEQFVRGEAAVDPLPGACDYCDLTPLCRRLAAGMCLEVEEEA
ncbi:MAG: PD-(D/E)XK nuclease family protein [Magnetococcales bacterium]|nr:PD-(D/E)XK nuclease family protein [Magnetococcales bacterium]